jgi:hypothetical protein
MVLSMPVIGLLYLYLLPLLLYNPKQNWSNWVPLPYFHQKVLSLFTPYTVLAHRLSMIVGHFLCESYSNIILLFAISMQMYSLDLRNIKREEGGDFVFESGISNRQHIKGI